MEADIPIAPSLYSLSNKMDNSLLAVRDINHKYIVVEKEHIYTIGGLELNEDRKAVSVDGEDVKVTPTEYKILLLLMKHPGRVFSADEIYEWVWEEEAVNTDTIMVHVRNIREKIEINPKEPKYLKVVWGVGYKIEKQA